MYLVVVFDWQQNEMKMNERHTYSGPQCALSASLNCKFRWPYNYCTFVQCTKRVTPSHIQHQEQYDHLLSLIFHNINLTSPSLRHLSLSAYPKNSSNCNHESMKQNRIYECRCSTIQRCNSIVLLRCYIVKKENRIVFVTCTWDAFLKQAWRMK